MGLCFLAISAIELYVSDADSFRRRRIIMGLGRIKRIKESKADEEHRDRTGVHPADVGFDQ